MPMRPLSPLLRRALGGARRRLGAAVIRLAGIREQLDRNGTAIALTFDDGPDPVATPLVLDELRRLGVVATFFLVGHRARARPDIVARILGEGHAVGSHSDTHPHAWRVPLTTIVREYRKGRSEVEEAAGRPVLLFRPPNGHVDAAGAAAMVVTRARPWLWTIDPGDWKPEARPADIMVELVGLRAGDVVLLHDAIDGPGAPPTTDRSATVAVLADIAALAHDRGLRFTTLS